MPTTTRTLGPLHLEDLEPHRFEDLVRQLLYDFRDWRSLEATGRAGGDEGFDARGWEVISYDAGPLEESNGEEPDSAAFTDRLWLVQCKREKSIGPARIRRVVEDMLPTGAEPPYGVLLVAACDFSKRSRDVFTGELAKRGVVESLIWGKGEVEDQLFLPKNDHLLFAYFNISLQLRRRAMRTALRSRLTIKRALVRALGSVSQRTHRWVLIRDPTDERYPNADDITTNMPARRWDYFLFVGHEPPDHLCFEVEHYFAYVDDEHQHWDALDFDTHRTEYQRPAFSGVPSEEETETEFAERQQWLAIPDPNRADLRVFRIIHYDRVLGVDEQGDLYNEGPHLYVEFNGDHGLFEPQKNLSMVEFNSPYQRERLIAEKKTRIKYFQG